LQHDKIWGTVPPLQILGGLVPPSPTSSTPMVGSGLEMLRVRNAWKPIKQCTNTNTTHDSDLRFFPVLSAARVIFWANYIIRNHHYTTLTCGDIAASIVEASTEYIQTQVTRTSDSLTSSATVRSYPLPSPTSF